MAQVYFKFITLSFIVLQRCFDCFKWLVILKRNLNIFYKTKKNLIKNFQVKSFLQKIVLKFLFTVTYLMYFFRSVVLYIKLYNE